MKYILYVLLFACLSANAQTALKAFSLQQVKLLPGIFKDAESTDLNYIMELKPDRLLAPYLREAGLKPKAESYTNWENTGLDGHIGGHYLSALAMMYASTQDQKVLARLNYMIAELKLCQDKNGDGYIGGVPGSKELWAQVKNGDLSDFKKKWVPFYNIHKTFAGVRDVYLYTDNQTAKNMLLKFADWFVDIANSITPQKMQEILRTEQGGVNEVLADVYALTGDKKYLKAAYSFSHQAILLPLENGQDKLDNLHANTQIPKIIGFKRIADVNADTGYNKAASFFWETVITHRTVAIGGNSVREHFNPAADFSSMISSEQGPETCNTYNMLKLTKSLFLSDPKVSYMDYYERALYNHILSTQHPGKGGFVYFTPMRPGHYRVYSQAETSMWCCVGSGMENHAKYSELIYAYNDINLFVNLFIPSQLTWKQKGLILTQQTNFPESEKTTLTINDVKAGAFGINIRYPSWVSGGLIQVLINGKPFNVINKPSSYISISRVWKKGDIIQVTLPMHNTLEKLPDGSKYEAVVHGPIVMAAVLDSTNMTGLFANDSRMGHVAQGKLYPLQQMPMFVSNTTNDADQIKTKPGAPLTFSAANLIYPAKYSNLTLVPFYKIHDDRYIIYWQRETPESLVSIQKKMADEEAEAAKLAALVIDMVNPGEQQPESDHFIESQNSNTGVNRDKHWRDTRSFFSYKFTDKAKQAATLRVTYFGRDKDRDFSILVNNQTIATIKQDGSRGNTFYTEDYPIPAALVNTSTGTLTVKFAAATGSMTGGVYELRLLKK
ncbi:glycoside hydrolase family 127 protein [Mucilaginibacter sp. HMF5004]|uniref:glycoside hydrolase family 127 protein n=1 Tax=Mucilaginibacter rivuli TaxID=2857527 RepID=UPI001C600964|nr:glycoside hydrolase family 127 protein [Mucilaginibacter rivuli]MBW4889398.1 glycoside hydrolase family 127 protein [Mucilaginibacter rivuli]